MCGVFKKHLGLTIRTYTPAHTVPRAHATTCDPSTEIEKVTTRRPRCLLTLQSGVTW